MILIMMLMMKGSQYQENNLRATRKLLEKQANRDLKFGDTGSINLKHRYEKLLDKEKYSKLIIKCPLCGSRIRSIFDLNIRKNWIAWKSMCGNKVFTDLRGNFIDSREP